MLNQILAFITAIATSVGGLFGLQQADSQSNLLSQLSSSSSNSAQVNLEEMSTTTVKQINELRATKGLAPLVVDEGMSAQARTHVDKLAASGQLTHSAEYTLLNESLYAFPFPKVNNSYPFDQFNRAQQDRQKMIDPKYTKIGLAFAPKGDDSRVILGVVNYG